MFTRWICLLISHLLFLDILPSFCWAIHCQDCSRYPNTIWQLSLVHVFPSYPDRQLLSQRLNLDTSETSQTKKSKNKLMNTVPKYSAILIPVNWKTSHQSESWASCWMSVCNSLLHPVNHQGLSPLPMLSSLSRLLPPLSSATLIPCLVSP